MESVQPILDRIILWIPNVVIALLKGDSIQARSPRVEKQIPPTRKSTNLQYQIDAAEEEQHLLSHVEAQDTSLVAIDHTIAVLTADVAMWKQSDAMKAEQIAAARKDIEKLQQELSTTACRNAELQQRCETLSKDLEGSRLFINTADIFADSEVIQMLQKLNAELQHTSSFMADHVLNVFKLDVTTSDPEQRMRQHSNTPNIIGSTLVKCLGTRNDNFEVSMYLQIAFQAYLTYQLYSIVSSWTADQGSSTVVNDIYQRLREREKQAVAGRWRFLTRVYALPSDPNSLVTPVVAGLSDILLAAGCTASQSDVEAELSSRFEKNILSAVLLAGRLNQMIGGVLSGDFEVLFVKPGETFLGTLMEEDTDDSGDVRGELAGTSQIVLCTSQLGLTKRIDLGTTGEKETKTVVKAKVILESFLDNDDE